LNPSAEDYWSTKSELEGDIDQLKHSIYYYENKDLTNIKILMEICREGALKGLNPGTKTLFKEDAYYFGWRGDIGSSPHHKKENIIGTTGSGDATIYYFRK